MRKFLVAALLVVGSMFVATPAKAAVFVHDAFGDVQVVEEANFGNFLVVNGFNPSVTVVRDGLGRPGRLRRTVCQ